MGFVPGWLIFFAAQQGNLRRQNEEDLPPPDFKDATKAALIVAAAFALSLGIALLQLRHADKGQAHFAMYFPPNATQADVDRVLAELRQEAQEGNQRLIEACEPQGYSQREYQKALLERTDRYTILRKAESGASSKGFRVVSRPIMAGVP